MHYSRLAYIESVRIHKGISLHFGPTEISATKTAYNKMRTFNGPKTEPAGSIQRKS